MKVRELIEVLQSYDPEMPVKLLVDRKVIDFEDNILHTSETAYLDASLPEDNWDAEDGKIMLGNGQQYILLNPIVF